MTTPRYTYLRTWTQPIPWVILRLVWLLMLPFYLGFFALVGLFDGWRQWQADKL